jgi:putative peptidoglycan lipid II flippase
MVKKTGKKRLHEGEEVLSCQDQRDRAKPPGNDAFKKGQETNKPQSYMKHFWTVGFFTALSRGLGFLREMIFASVFGASLTADIFLLALRLPALFRRVFGEGAFNASFLPIFSKIRGNKPYLTDQALRFSGGILFYLSFALVVLTICVEAGLPWIAHVFFPGLSNKPQGIALFIDFSRILFPYVVLVCLTAFYSSILNAFSKFSAAASYPVIGNMFCILGFWIFIPGTLGMEFSPVQDFTLTQKGCWMAWIVLFSGVVQLLWVIAACIGQGLMVGYVRPGALLSLERSAVKEFFRKFGPGVANVGIINLNIFIGMSIASFLPAGSIAYLSYSDRINQLPLSLIGTSIGTTLLPLYARSLAQGGEKMVLQTQNRTIRMALIASVPILVFLVGFGQPLIDCIFGHGAFRGKDVLETSKTLMASSLGLPAYILIKVLSTNFFARGDMRSPLVATMVGVIVDILLSIVLMFPLKHIGIALSMAISAWVNVIVLGYFLKKRHQIALDHSFRKFLKRFFWVSCFLIGIVIPAGYSLAFMMMKCHHFFSKVVMMGASALVFALLTVGLFEWVGLIHTKQLRQRFLGKRS